MPKSDDKPPDVFGIGTLGAAAMNMGSSIVMNNINNAEASRREEIARQENYMYNEKAANAADARTRALYNDLYSPQAQMQQIKDAGLSPSVFYGSAGGISGQTGAQGAGAAGVSPTPYGMPNLDYALIAKALSEAKLNEAKADTERGDNERGQAEISKLYQDTATKLSEQNLNEAKTAVEESQECLNELDAELKSETFWTNVAHVEAEVQNLNALTNDINNAAALKATEYQFNQEIFDERIKQFKKQGIKQAYEILGIKASNKKIDAEINAITETIAQNWQKIDIKERDVESIMNDRNLRRHLKNVELTLMREKIDLEHADRRVQMLLSYIANLVSTAGMAAMAF